MKLLAVIGTRPEAVKMAPVLMALRREAGIKTLVCASGQHRELLDQVLRFFRIAPDFDLDLMEPEQQLNALTAKALTGLDTVLDQSSPDWVLVHGDTTTALAAALGAFHRGIPIAHVEAGLRTYRHDQPRPEEMNRRSIDMMSDLLFAPTPAAKRNLAGERLQGRVLVTGNSGIDALELVLARLGSDSALRQRIDSVLPPMRLNRKLLLVTAHRRESFGGKIRQICAALAELAQRPDLDIVYPVHPSPRLQAPVEGALAGLRNVHLLPPLDLPSFVRLMQRADLILTDSGGVQEEAASLGRQVLVIRDVTDRPEALAAGAAHLVGTSAARIVREAAALLDSGGAPASSNPYGDGRASARIVSALLGRPVEEFSPSEVAEVPTMRRLAV